MNIRPFNYRRWLRHCLFKRCDDRLFHDASFGLESYILIPSDSNF